jgi:hypothetical protein
LPVLACDTRLHPCRHAAGAAAAAAASATLLLLLLLRAAAADRVGFLWTAAATGVAWDQKFGRGQCARDSVGGVAAISSVRNEIEPQLLWIA